MNLEELEKDFKTHVARSGIELTGVLFQGAISKLADEWWTVVAKAQRARGEAEEATAAAQATKAAAETKLIDVRQAITTEAEELRNIQATRRDTQAELVKEKEELNKIKATIAGMRADAKQAKKSLDLIADNEGA